MMSGNGASYMPVGPISRDTGRSARSLALSRWETVGFKCTGDKSLTTGQPGWLMWAGVGTLYYLSQPTCEMS